MFLINSSLYFILVTNDLFSTEEAAMNAGMEALVGIMEGARMENELRARKYISRLLWLMKVSS